MSTEGFETPRKLGSSTSGALRSATATLAAAGVPSPDFDAAELLAHVLGTTRTALALVGDLPAERREEYDDLVARRARREPLQHLTGSAAFRYVELAVGPGVFTPRPETELLAGWGVDRAREVLASRPDAGGGGPVHRLGRHRAGRGDRGAGGGGARRRAE